MFYYLHTNTVQSVMVYRKKVLIAVFKDYKYKSESYFLQGIHLMWILRQKIRVVHWTKKFNLK